jgi:hypothetical protein
MTITGDAGSNIVLINDNGTTAHGNVRVQCDGTLSTFPDRTISKVFINTLDGQDLVLYQLNARLGASVHRAAPTWAPATTSLGERPLWSERPRFPVAAGVRGQFRAGQRPGRR